MSRKVAVFRKEHFNAAHRLFVPSWSDEKNIEVFGKCANPNYHGHNYVLEVKLVGEPDPLTGYVFDLKKLSDLVKKYVLDEMDHKNLNLDSKYFREINPTAENIVITIHDILKEHIDTAFDLQVRLYETERNFVRVPRKDLI